MGKITTKIQNILMLKTSVPQRRNIRRGRASQRRLLLSQNQRQHRRQTHRYVRSRVYERLHRISKGRITRRKF